MMAEVLGGLLTGSLALLADAGLQMNGSRRRMPASILIRVMACVFVVFLGAAFQSKPNVVGAWKLSVIDHVPVEDIPPERFDMGSLLAQRGLDLQSGDAWAEFTIRSSNLRIYPDGDFREVRVKKVSFGMKPAAYSRVVGRPPPGGVSVVPFGVDTSRIVGRWVVEADSLILFQTRDQLEAGLAAGLEQTDPLAQRLAQEGVDLREKLVKGVLGEAGILDTLVIASDTVEVVVRARGAVSETQLAVSDFDGRQLIYRGVEDRVESER